MLFHRPKIKKDHSPFRRMTSFQKRLYVAGDQEIRSCMKLIMSVVTLRPPILYFYLYSKEANLYLENKKKGLFIAGNEKRFSLKVKITFP